ncbi:MAG: NfeD family protein [Brevinema sp.]
MDQNTLYVFWWIVALMLLVLELLTPATIFIFLALVALIVGFFALLVDNIWIQGVLFFIGSGVAIALIRPLFVMSKKDVGYKQGSEALIGKKVKVVETINNLENQGRIQHAADIFPARSQDQSVITQGSWVIIHSVEGITVFVSLVDNG